MKYFLALLRLIRWPNLIFIALTQFLFYYCIVGGLPADSSFFFSAERKVLWMLLVLASLLIAAAGYIINDYFDVNIDVVNKPDRVVVDRIVHRRWAIFLHFFFSVAGLVLSFYVSRHVGSQWIFIGNLLAVVLLWFYSTTFKRKVLSGNILISLLTAWVLFVLYFFAGGGFPEFQGFHNSGSPIDVKKLYLLTNLYAGFAFIISLVREVVKDLEDMEGDSQNNCRTIPIVWGVPAAKLFCLVWMAVLSLSLIIISGYAIQSGWWQSALYLLLFVILPLVRLSILLSKAVGKGDYHRLSGSIKLVMLAGILSMLFFKFLH